MGVALKDDNGVENENVKALQLLCKAFEEKMKQFKEDNTVTDDARVAQRKLPNGKNPFLLISTKVVSPMQSTAKNRNTGEIEDLANPFFWLSIPKKKYFKGTTPKESMHFEDKYYADETGQPDLEHPVMTHDYAPEFFNVDDVYHHSRTGKKIYKHLGAPNGDDFHLDNTNIQNFLTKGSAMLGNLKFELAVSGRQCKLDVALYGRFIVKKAETVESNAFQNDDSIDAFSCKYAGLVKSPPLSAAVDLDEDDEFFED
jgi:hypothetical protein